MGFFLKRGATFSIDIYLDVVAEVEESFKKLLVMKLCESNEDKLCTVIDGLLHMICKA